MSGSTDRLVTVTFDMEIRVEQGETTGTGLFCPRPSSRANTMPGDSHDRRPSGEMKRPQRRNSSSGVAKRTEDEYEKLQQRLKELESEVETLQLQVQEGHRGRERLTLEMETLRFDGLQKEAESIIRKMEWLAENATETPSVAMSSVSLDSSDTTGPTQLTSLPNDARNPEIGVEAIHPKLSPPTILEQPGLANYQRQPSWSLAGEGQYAGYSTYEHTHLHQGPSNRVSPGWAPHVYLGPVDQSQYPLFSPIIDIQNRRQPPHSNREDSQQGRPRSLPHPYAEGNTPYPHHPHPSWLRYPYGEYFYGGSTTPMYGEVNNLSCQSSRPRAQQASAEGDDTFCGGFNPHLYQPS